MALHWVSANPQSKSLGGLYTLSRPPASGSSRQLRRQARIRLLFTEAIRASSPRPVLPGCIACAVPPSPVSPQVPDFLGAAQDKDGAGLSSVASLDRHFGQLPGFGMAV